MESAELVGDVNAVESFPNVGKEDRILVTGATGWVGRELIARLWASRPEIPILSVASQPRVMDLGPAVVVVEPWDHDAISGWNPTLAVHLAFLTREQEAHWGPVEYERRNQDLSMRATKIYGIPSIRGVAVASSGAAVKWPNSTYGRLKARDEQIFTEIGVETGIPTLIGRIWSLSGAHCTKPNAFALYDLIRQTWFQDVVVIDAAHEVRRSYVDAGEFLELCLGALGVGYSGVIDSAGPVVEIGHLALVIQETLGRVAPIMRPPVEDSPDDYFAQSATQAEWAHRLDMSLSGLAEQIQRSSRALSGVAAP